MEIGFGLFCFLFIYIFPHSPVSYDRFIFTVCAIFFPVVFDKVKVSGFLVSFLVLVCCARAAGSGKEKIFPKSQSRTWVCRSRVEKAGSSRVGYTRKYGKKEDWVSVKLEGSKVLEKFVCVLREYGTRSNTFFTLFLILSFFLIIYNYFSVFICSFFGSFFSLSWGTEEIQHAHTYINFTTEGD